MWSLLLTPKGYVDLENDFIETFDLFLERCVFINALA